MSRFVALTECWAQGMLGKSGVGLYVQMKRSQSPAKKEEDEKQEINGKNECYYMPC